MSERLRCGYKWTIHYLPVLTDPVLVCALAEDHPSAHMAVDPDGRVVLYPYEIRIDSTVTND